MATITLDRPSIDRERVVRWLRGNAVWLAIVVLVVIDGFAINNFRCLRH